MRGEILWETISAQQVHKGVSVKPHVNVIFHLPSDMTRITRRTLFGRTGERVRYWGYCFPENADDEYFERQAGLPGRIFLSDLEQTYVRNAEAEMRQKNIHSLQNLTQEDLNESESIRGLIRHQKDVFVGGDTCYLMTSDAISIGVDTDGDMLNSKLEADYNTNVNIADTDGDGILDGLEVFGLKTIPTIRDTDGDALPDGLEDKNLNGRIDIGETSPTEWDSDRDGLCDGYCYVDYSLRSGYMAPVGFVPHDSPNLKFVWEDKNLNGIVDDEETDPLKKDTDGDGILDEEEYYECFIHENGDCNMRGR